jgi:hypothetical protein
MHFKFAINSQNRQLDRSDRMFYGQLLNRWSEFPNLRGHGLSNRGL